MKRPWKAVAAGGVALGVLGIGLLVGRRNARTISAGRVALIGDSYAVGLGPELAKLLPDFRFEGHVGTTTKQWAQHATACGTCGDWLTAFKPSVVLVSLGVNDGATSSPTYYQSIVRGLQGIGARVVWIEPPAVVQTAARDMISALGVQTVPATNVPLAADGLHPTGAGYQTWAEEVAGAVSRV